MNAEELEGQLEGRHTSRDIAEALARMTGEQLVDDLLLALRGSPLGLHFAQHLPLSELPVRTRSPWQYLVEDQLQIAAAAERLVSVAPLISSPLLRSRANELIWWTLPDHRSGCLADCLASTRLVAEASPDPIDRLAAAWSGCELAALTRNDEVLSALRRAAADSAFQMVIGAYESDVSADFEMASGLMYLYGVIANWDSLPIAREISVICELADRRTRNRLPAGWPRGCAAWLHRLRYVAAQSDDERVRVVEEACAERRHAVATSPFPHDLSPPVMEAGELSRAIEDASLEAARLSGSKALRERMEQLTRDLVVELQDLGWQVTSARTSLVSPEDVSRDARDAESNWRVELAGVDSDLLARITWLALRESPLESPPGLDVASESHRLNVGRHRGQVRAHGFMAPDTLRSKNLDELAYAEMSRHRQETWGLVVVEALTTAALRTEDGLSSVFGGPMIRPEIAERFVHALKLFLNEDYDAAAHVILPRLETSIRAVAVTRRIPALQIAYKSLGNISYLDALLRELERDALPHTKAHWVNLRLLLVDGQGASIRNTLSHGLRSDGGVSEVVSAQEAALLLYVAMFLSALDGQGTHPLDQMS